MTEHHAETQDDALRAVLAPITVGGVALRNRVFVPGHTTNFGHDNLPTDRHVAYHAERARGGVGLIITEAIRVHPTSAGRHISLGSFDDAGIPAYAAVADAVHAEGAAIFAQIMHAGRQANGDATRTVAWSASALPWSTGAPVPHVMGRRDIATLVVAFGAAATRMSQAGYDGVEVHMGHGHLLQQFLSPATNQRTDRYGGCQENRLRLTREVLTEIRARAPELPIGLRVSADEFLPDGLRPPDVIEFVARLREEFPLAYVHVSHSAYHGSWSLATQMADMSFPHAPFRRHAAEFRRALPDLPVLAVCRLDSVAQAARLVADGDADLVGLARPHIADPHLVRKAAEGRAAETRSCLACNQACIGRVEANLPISCVVNPEVGAEAVWSRVWTASPRRRRVVLVVGGGPAGMEAALAADRQGHRVTLVEAQGELGGQLTRAARVHGRQRLRLLVDDLRAELDASRVEVCTATSADVELVRTARPDDVIIATGSVPSRRALPGGPPVLDLWQAVTLFAEYERIPGCLAILDETGSWAAASIAEHCANRGSRVHLVSPAASVGAGITTYSRLALTSRYTELGVRVHPLRTVRAADRDQLTLVDPISGQEEPLAGVDVVVDAGQPSARDGLYRELEDVLDEDVGLHIVGDANAPRTALEAVYEGRVAGAVHTSGSDPERVLLALAR